MNALATLQSRVSIQILIVDQQDISPFRAVINSERFQQLITALLLLLSLFVLLGQFVDLWQEVVEAVVTVNKILVIVANSVWYGMVG